MSDYTSTFTEGTGDTIDAADFSTEFDAIETAIATKVDKNSSLSGYAGGILVYDTVQASTSGTNIDFTGIPSWAKRVTLLLDSVSIDAATTLEMLLGTSGGMNTTADYEYTYSTLTNAAAVAVSGNSAFSRWRLGVVTDANAKMTGKVTIENITGNIWIATAVISNQYSFVMNTMSGIKDLGGTLTQLRITANSNAFDAGQINMSYEG